MSDFEFLFSLFGLLLGFVLVEVLGGLVRALQPQRGDVAATPSKTGLLTPLLAAFVVLDVTSYWANIWGIREHLTVGTDTLFGGVLIAGAYYFAASMVFPKDGNRATDLDAWFWAHRRQVLGLLLIVNLGWITLYTALGTRWEDLGGAALVQLGYFVPLTVATFARNPFFAGGSMALLILGYLIIAATGLMGRLG